jgi:DNA invertase Pin-like site-specific DNA recombinase
MRSVAHARAAHRDRTDAGYDFALGEMPVAHRPWADTTTPHGRLMVTVLAGLVEFERSLILARHLAGRTVCS